MKIALFQPPYPQENTIASAGECFQWMRRNLDQLESGGQDLVLLPEYTHTMIAGGFDALRRVSANQTGIGVGKNRGHI